MDRIFFMSLIGCSWIQACAPSPDDAHLTDSIVDPSGTVLTLGKGYESLMAEARGFCVTTDVGLDEETRKSVSYEIGEIGSPSQLRERFSIGPAAGLKLGLFARNSPLAFFDNLPIGDYTAHFFLRVEVRLHSIALGAHKLTPTAKVRLDESVETFRAFCGEAFVDSVTYGGSFTAFVSIGTRSREEFEDARRGIAAAAGVLASGHEVSARLEQLSSFRDLKVGIAKLGGPPELPNLGEQDIMGTLISYAAGFQRAVEEAPDRSYPIAVGIKPLTLAVPELRPSSEDMRRSEVQTQIAMTLEMVRDHAARLDYILARPEEFLDTDLRALTGVRESLDHRRRRLMAAGKACSTPGTPGCDFSNETIAADFEWPERRRGMTLREVCERERRYLHDTGRLTEAQYRSLMTDDLVPMYRSPGERLSGTIGLGSCDTVGQSLRQWLWR